MARVISFIIVALVLVVASAAQETFEVVSPAGKKFSVGSDQDVESKFCDVEGTWTLLSKSSTQGSKLVKTWDVNYDSEQYCQAACVRQSAVEWDSGAGQCCGDDFNSTGFCPDKVTGPELQAASCWYEGRMDWPACAGNSGGSIALIVEYYNTAAGAATTQAAQPCAVPTGCNQEKCLVNFNRCKTTSTTKDQLFTCYAQDTACRVSTCQLPADCTFSGTTSTSQPAGKVGEDKVTWTAGTAPLTGGNIKAFTVTTGGVGPNGEGMVTDGSITCRHAPYCAVKQGYVALPYKPKAASFNAVRFILKAQSSGQPLREQASPVVALKEPYSGGNVLLSFDMTGLGIEHGGVASCCSGESAAKVSNLALSIPRSCAGAGYDCGMTKGNVMCGQTDIGNWKWVDKQLDAGKIFPFYCANSTGPDGSPTDYVPVLAANTVFGTCGRLVTGRVENATTATGQGGAPQSFVITCTTGGQLCEPPYRFDINTNGVLQLQYTPAASHCSSIRLHISVDGNEVKTTDFIAPGAQASLFDLGPVTPGTHTIALKAEGTVGGCNTGVLLGWGGTVTVVAGAASSSGTTGGTSQSITFTDDFNRADSADVGNGWTEFGGDISISGSALAVPSAKGGILRNVGTLAGAASSGVRYTAHANGRMIPGIWLCTQGATMDTSSEIPRVTGPAGAFCVGGVVGRTDASFDVFHLRAGKLEVGNLDQWLANQANAAQTYQQVSGLGGPTYTLTMDLLPDNRVTFTANGKSVTSPQLTISAPLTALVISDTGGVSRAGGCTAPCQSKFDDLVFNGQLKAGTASCPSASLPSGAVSHWPGDGNANDAIDGNQGTLQNGATFAAGKVGQAFSFDGVDDIVVVGNPANLQLQDFTIAAWIKLSTLSLSGPQQGGGVMVAGYDSGGYGFGLGGPSTIGPGALNPIRSGELLLTKVDFNGVSSQGMAVSDTNWHHVAVTKSGGTVTFYMDGSAKTVPISYNPGFTFSTNFALGMQADSGAPFPGLIDEVQVFNRALTPAEVNALHTGSAGTCPTVNLEYTTPFDFLYASRTGLTHQYACIQTGGTMTSSVPGQTANCEQVATALPGAITWHFDEGQGTTAAASGGPTGTVQNAAWTTNSALGSALSFSNDVSKVLLPDYIIGKNTPFTIEAWVNPSICDTGVDNAAIYREGDSYDGMSGVSFGLSRKCEVSLGWLRLDLGKDWQSTKSQPIPTGVWTHVAGSWDGTTQKVYVNGELAGTRPVTDSPNDGSGLTYPAVIGASRYHGSFPGTFEGIIDEVSVYRRALSDDEVRQRARKGAATCPLGNYPCAGSPPTCSSPSTTVTLGGAASIVECADNQTVLATGSEPLPIFEGTLTLPAGVNAITGQNLTDVYNHDRIPYYCSTKAKWIDGLDEDEGACLGAGFTWTGRHCCGDPGGSGTGTTTTTGQTASCTGQCATPPSGAISWWKGEGNANDAIDGNHGTLQNGATFAAGKTGQAFSFDGTSSVTLNAAPTVPNQGSFTYDLWINVVSYTNGTIDSGVGDGSYFVDRTAETFPLVDLKAVAGHFGFQVRYDDGTGLGGPVGGNIVLGTWTHVAMVRQYGVAFRLYVDGQLVASSPDNGKSLTPHTPKLGHHDLLSRLGFVGLIDEFKIFNRVLSASEIQSLASPACTQTCPLGNYPCTGSPATCTSPAVPTQGNPQVVAGTGEYYNDPWDGVSLNGGCWNSKHIARGAFVDNSTKKVVNVNGVFYGCALPAGDPALALVDKFGSPPGSLLVQNQPYCRNFQNVSQGKSLYCSTKGSWTVDTTGNRSRLSRILWEPENASSQTAECCAQNDCWDGSKCVTNQRGDSTPTTTHEYRCINGEWKNQSLKFNWDRSKFGYCEEESQCLVDPQGSYENNNKPETFLNSTKKPQCIADGQYILDFYCEKGNWSSRTKQIAVQLLDFAAENSPSNYKLFCDAAPDALNNIVFNTQAGPVSNFIGNCSISGTAVPCVNNFCVLTHSGGVAFGTSLNVPVNSPQSFLRALDRPETACNGAIDSDRNYNACSPTIWYDKATNSVIAFHPVAGTLTPASKEVERARITVPHDQLVNFVMRALHMKPNNYSFYANPKLFQNLYSTKVGNYDAFAFLEENQFDGFTKRDYIGIQGPAQFNVCELVKHYDPLGECNSTATAYVITERSDVSTKLIGVWRDLTAKLRPAGMLTVPPSCGDGI
ncbi:LamG domain-containing protein, partial [Candidatus Woesearchaeota archaeon]|nr:LamG domain-containing protein [Candidatus Woesearchaeota archaeon]